MSVSAEVRHFPPSSSRRPEVAEAPHDEIVVTISDDGAPGRHSDLWAELEEALEVAVGRLVIVDMTQVTAFDQHTLDALTQVADAAARRRDSLCAVAPPSSSLAQHVLRCGTRGALAVFSSVAGALAANAVAADADHW